jgi:glycosyltransferase involved in cell wall biosynthesis
MKTVSVIVPVYYNAESLPLLFEELQKVEGQLHERACAMELIFVDDGSGDESMIELMKVKQQRPDTRVVKLTRNFGAVHACRVGLNYATGDCTMWLSADLQDPPEMVIKMTDQWLAGSKFVIALRERRADPPLTIFFGFCNSPKMSTVWNGPASGQRAVKVAPCRRLWRDDCRIVMVSHSPSRHVVRAVGQALSSHDSLLDD